MDTPLPNDPEYLFVYGTLLMDSGHNMAYFLSQHTSSIAEAYFPGKLYEVADYPGATWDEQADTIVKGKLVKLIEPAAIWSSLDRYEGFAAQDPVNSLYIRKVIPVICNNTFVYSWVYLYNQPTDSLEWIPSGDYLSYKTT